MSDANNPYLPPKAVVFDVASDSVLVRPMAVTIALYLIGARVLMNLVVFLSSVLGTRASFVLGSLLIAGLSVVVTTALGVFIARGRNWARIVYLVFTLLSLVSITFSLINMFDLPAGVSMRGGVSGWWLATILVPPAISVAVVVLLFGPGRAWFAPRE